MSIDPLRSPLHFSPIASRRDFLARAGAGFGAVALASLLHGEQAAAAGSQFPNPIAPKPPQFPAKAKSVIWCFLDGGPSHIDLFDPKPALKKLAGKPLPDSFERPTSPRWGKTAYAAVGVARSEENSPSIRPIGHVGQRLVSRNAARYATTSL